MKKLLLGLCLPLLFSFNEAPTSQNVTTYTLDLTKSGVKSKRGNDIWGWTDPVTNKEYAIMGMNNKTSFVDITTPSKPIHIADIKTRTYSSTWRDIKVYKDHAYIVSEASRHGMQIFDMTRLRKYTGKKVATLKSDVDYRKFGSAHNIFINEDSGYAYSVGSTTCDGGLHIMNIQDPKAPKFVNCVGRGIYELPKPPQNRDEEDDVFNKHGDAYTHDVQCVIYNGPDMRFVGHEICISSNEDTVNVVDVTDKSNPYQLSVSTYGGVRYTHQGWLTEDHRYFLLGDELDEKKFGVNTKTFIWDFSDLKDIKHFATHTHPSKAIDHNLYVKGNYVYQANYEAGMRILDLTDVANGKLNEVAFMDPLPSTDKPTFKGVWSVFPYYKSGTVVVSGTDGTLFVTIPKLK